MAASTHRTRQNRVMLGLLVAVLLLAPGVSALARTVRIDLGESRKTGIEFLMKERGISRDAADRLARQYEVKNGNRILDFMDLPEGAQLDFWKVRNHADPSRRVEFGGRGTLVHATSYLGRNYKELLFGLLNTSQRQEALDLLKQAREHGFMIIPTAMQAGPGKVGTAATQTYTVGVIVPEFPHWIDMRPVGSGTVGQRSGTFYASNVTAPPGVKTYPIRPGMGQDGGGLGAWSPSNTSIHNDAWEEWDPDYYADSPGGPINTSGMPLGLANNTSAWSGSGVTATTNADGHPRYGGDIRAGSVYAESPLQLRQRMFDLFFNKGLTSSLYSWFYANSHAHISIEGTPSSIIGWIDDHHVLDRLPRGSSNFYAVQPGTPFYRPQDPAGPGIVRASLWSNGGTNGLTLFFRQDVDNLSLGQITLRVHQTIDIDSVAANTQTGTVQIVLGGATAGLNADPWDHRRWTVTDVDWEFVDQGDATKRIDYSHARGSSWSVEVSGHAAELGANPAVWNNASTGYRNQGNGCADFPAYSPLPGVNIPRTLAYTGDTVIPRAATGVTSTNIGSSMGNRLMSFCYYAHNGSYPSGEAGELFATFSSSGSAYQLQTLRNGSGETDPIAGYVDSAQDRAPRFYPFDHDMRDHNYPNMGGYFGTSSPYHSDGQCWADVTQVMRDQGITYSNYNQLILMYPGANDNASGGESLNAGGFIAHSGNPIPVSTGAGVLLLAHEMCHNFGATDLYDNHFYTNNATPRPSPLYFQAHMFSPYSVMTFGGFRLDAWHKLGMGYATPTNVLRDLGFTRIDQVEQTTADPLILKLPAHPLAVYASKNPTAPAGFTGTQADWNNLANPDSWSEYFLVENRNVTTGAYAGDRSPRGLYVYHIDQRTGQTREDWHMVKLVQADGREDLETVADSTGMTQDQINGDPFPGSVANRFLTERSVRLGNGRNSPTSWSNGVPDAGGATIRPNTPTDSFVRITSISGPSAGPGGTPNAAGDPMTAFIYVEPAEVVVTGQTLIPAADPGKTFYEVQQGTKDFPVLLLNVDNDGQYPNLSTNAVTIDSLRVYEVGTSLSDGNIAVAKLYEDTDDSGDLDLAQDTLLKAATVSADNITFTNLGYTLQLNQDRNLIVAYDIDNNAQTSPTVTVGAELTTHDFVDPLHPGAVQQRVRLASGGTVQGGPGYNFGNYHFPIPGTVNRTARIVESPDTLVVDTFNLAPATAVQGANDVPIMRMQLSVNHDAVTVSGIRVNQTGTSVGGTDVSIVRAYHDTAGNGVIDAGDPVLGEAAVIGGSGVGEANIGGLSFDVSDVAQQHIILAVNVTPDATAAATIQLQLQPGCMVLQANPTDPLEDQVDYSNFPHTHGDAPNAITEIIPGNRPPYAPPASNHATYGSDWYPRGGISVEDARPVCTFPRARGTSAAPPNDDPDPDTTYDTADLMRYTVQFSTSPAFATIAHVQNLNPPHVDGDGNPAFDVLSFQVSAVLAPAQYYWRVRTTDTQGAQSPWSAPAAVFIVANRPTAPTGPFSPVSVPAGSGNTMVSVNRPTYSWTIGTDVETPAAQLQTVVQVDDNADFSSPLFQATSLPGVANSGGWAVDAGVGSGSDILTRGVHYFWRARTLDGSSTLSDWTTAVLDFSVGDNLQPTPPQPPFVPSGDQVVTSANPTLAFGAASDPDPEDNPGGFTYYVQLDDNADWTDDNLFEGTVDPPIAGSPITLALTPAIMPVPLADNMQYFWRVQTRDRVDASAAFSDWTGSQSFYVNLQNDPPKAPSTGFSPANASRIRNTTPDLSCDPTVDPDPPNNPDPTGQVAGYQFRLKYEPADPATWDVDADYDYQYTSATNQVAVTTPLTDPLPNGRWYWAVRARDDFGAWSPWSVSLYFRLNRPPTAPPTPGVPPADWVPADGEAVVPTPVCQFPPGDDPDETDDPSNLTYRVEFSQDAAFDTVFPANIYTVLPNPNDLSVVPFQVTNALPTGVWYWRVQAADQAGATSAYSQVHHFLVDNPPTPPQAPFSPSGSGDTGRYPLYEWVIGADPDPADLPATLVTVIEVDDNIDFTSPEYGGEVASSAGASSLDAFIAGLDELRPGVTYYWRAKTRDQAGLESAWATVQSFVVVDNTAPAPPRFMWPNNGQEVDQAKPIVYWDAATDPDDAAATLRYEVQLDDNSDWGDANVWEGQALGTDIRVLDGRVFVEVDAPAPGLLDNTQYYYRIRTIDPANQTSDWSTTQNFWVNTANNPPEPPATGFSPTNGEIVSSLPAVLRCSHAYDPDPSDPTWPGGPYLTYIYQLQRDAAPTDASYTYQYTVVANTMPSVQPQVQAIVTNDLGEDDPDQEHPWYWRVRAIDDQGAQSGWSSVQYFYVDSGNQPPTLAPSGSYAQALTPKYGKLNPPTHFSFSVVYTDAENDPPIDVDFGGQTGAVWLEIDGDPAQRIAMRKADDTDIDYRNGVTYIAGLNADDPILGIGAHTFTFYTAGWSIQWPPLDPVNPPANFDLWGKGPVIGTDSTVAFTDGAWDATAIPTPGLPPDVVVDAGYEEGRDVIRVQLTDTDKAGRGQLNVTLSTAAGQPPQDVETLVLTEDLGQPAGTFRGQMAILGRAEQFGDAESGLPIGDPGRVLNVIAGPGGNLVTVRYQDPDEASDFPAAMQRDTSQDTVLVVDTTPPPAVPDATLSLATGVNAYGNSDGTSIDVNWAGYLQPGPPYEQTDITGYDLYLSATGAFDLDVDVNGDVVFTPPNAAVLVTNLGRNQTSYTITGSETALTDAGIAIIPGNQYHVALVPVDEVPNRDVPVSSKPVTTADTQHPILSDESPVDGSTEVPLGTPISFRLEDPASGIDETTLQVRVRRAPMGSPADTGTWYDINADPDALGWQRAASGGLSDRTYTYSFVPVDPEAPGFFALNQRVEVQVICADQAGNAMDSWSPAAPFTRLFTYTNKTDLNPPQVINQSPADGATNVLPTTPVTFNITDDIAGVDVSSIAVQINGQPIGAAEGLVIDAADPLNVAVSYPAPSAAVIPWGATIVVRVWANDLAGNAIPVATPVEWSYDTQGDTTGPAMDITALSPAPGATNVPIDSDISFRLTDDLSGVAKLPNGDWDVAVYIKVGAASETLVPYSDLAFAGTARALRVTYNGPAFSYEDVVVVRVVSTDAAGNELGDESPVIGLGNGFEWTFTCASPPRYRIAGTIVDQDAKPLPGVVVRCWADGQLPEDGQQVTTDGNGTYIIQVELGGDFTVRPELTEYTFVPAERDVAVAGADVVDQDFVGTLKMYSIRGTVLLGGVGLQGVTLSTTIGGATVSVVSDANGDYVIPNVPNGRYTITPSLDGYSFRPGGRTRDLASADLEDVDFEAIANTYTISGTVRNWDGDRMAGVRVSDGTRSTVTNDSGEFSLADVSAGTVELTASKTGYKLLPASLQVTVPVPAGAPAIEFTAYVSFANSFPAAEDIINLIGVPCHPADTDPDSVFGDRSDVVRWNPLGAPPAYVYAGVGTLNQDVVDVQPGRGFFVRLRKADPADPTKTIPNADLEVAGRPVTTARPFTLSLGPIWNMAANPYTTALPYANIVPATADSVRNYGYVYDATLRNYLLVSALPGINVARSHVLPWEGIWLRTNGGAATVNMQAAAQTTDAPVAPQALELGSGGWALPIVASAGGSVDATTAVGVGPALAGAHQIFNPPMAPRSVDVFVRGADGSALAQDVKPDLTANPVWTLSVATDIPGAQVALSMPDLSSVPNDRAVYLTDLKTGKRMYARTMTSYRFEVGASGGSRDFKLEVVPRAGAGLVITSAVANAGTRGTVVTFNVSKDCQVTAEVLNVAGRVVRSLCAGRDATPGVNTLNWDLTSSQGTRVPSGRYMIRINVVSEDGQQVTAVTSATVNR